ncbi:hypothetical protein MUA02_12310 [Enterobacteriaceae bacterium H20N1]|uniref:Uncharacterized protein n=1 Tax=Dryocola boscaweniae TaxID=2925397 RepID=A0A9X2W8A3_9ENTR|nr:hypothetical protein [Dryocola boscaweniae]MCT4702645.1 hypothetical protein [Dryocola boscaweniae]MCT4719813.1 hypothetical protein [Dryocola boscaweniae]
MAQKWRMPRQNTLFHVIIFAAFYIGKRFFQQKRKKIASATVGHFP